MARDYQTYDFRSVGNLEEEFENRVDSLPAPKRPIGIMTPLRLAEKNNSVFEMHDELIMSIRDNLKNLIMTNHGERLMIPNYGANLRDLLFEFGTSDGDAKVMQQIAAAVRRHMPFVELKGFTPIKKIGESGDISKVSARITFGVPTMNFNDIGLEVILYEGS